jgi:hypothetical protein
MDRLQRLIAALWFGSAFFLMLAASAAFRAAGNTSVAADVVGSMLTRWHYIALAAPLALFALELRRARAAILILLFTAIVLAATQSFIDLRIRSMRLASYVPISELDREHPVRRRFGALHGASMTLLLFQTIAAAVVVITRDKRERRVIDPVAPAAGVPLEEVSAPETPPAEDVPPAETTGGGP